MTSLFVAALVISMFMLTSTWEKTVKRKIERKGDTSRARMQETGRVNREARLGPRVWGAPPSYAARVWLGNVRPVSFVVGGRVYRMWSTQCGDIYGVMWSNVE